MEQETHRCPACGGTETKVEYHNETILLVCATCSALKSKSWF